MSDMECEHGDDPATCPPCQRVPGYNVGPEAADCRSCGQPIIWTVTIRGKRMPVDAEPDVQGNIMLEQSTAGAPPTAVYSKASLLSVDERHTSHFATCPQSDEWRRR